MGRRVPPLDLNPGDATGVTYVGFSTFGGDVFRDLQMGGGGQKWYFLHNLSSAYRRRCVVNTTTTEAWRTPSRFSGFVYSADRRRLTRVLNGAVDTVDL